MILADILFLSTTSTAMEKMTRASDSTRNASRKTASSPSKHLISWSLFWGGLLSVGFYGALHNGLITHPRIVQYCTMHPIEYAIVILFFVGLAFVGVKYFELLGQFKLLQKGPILPPRGPEKVPVARCEAYLETVEEAVRKRNRGHADNHTERLRTALQFLHTGGDPEMLDMELRYMSDDDANNADAEYGFVRTILWAVPMLGFLGTVVGITQALGNLDLNAINESSKALSAGLSVAFDTTALAIGLDLVLYFFQFLTYRKESAMLRDVDRMVETELRGRFEIDEDRRTGHGNEITAVRRMLTRVVESLESLTESQTDIWNRAIGTANERFAMLASESAELVKTSLAGAINETVANHTAGIATLEKRFGEEIRASAIQIAEAIRSETVEHSTTIRSETARFAEEIRSETTRFLREAREATEQQLDTFRSETERQNQNVSARTQEYNAVLRAESQKFHEGLRSNAEALLALETAITKQTDAATATVDATAQLSVLEDRLNSNLATLAQVGHFEQTVNALAAAIHMLSSKHLGNVGAGAENVRLRTVTEKNARGTKRKTPGSEAEPQVENTDPPTQEAGTDKDYAA